MSHPTWPRAPGPGRESRPRPYMVRRRVQRWCTLPVPEAVAAMVTLPPASGHEKGPCPQRSEVDRWGRGWPGGEDRRVRGPVRHSGLR
jgi:hypothetical protein